MTPQSFSPFDAPAPPANAHIDPAQFEPTVWTLAELKAQLLHVATTYLEAGHIERTGEPATHLPVAPTVRMSGAVDRADVAFVREMALAFFLDRFGAALDSERLRTTAFVRYRAHLSCELVDRIVADILAESAGNISLSDAERLTLGEAADRIGSRVSPVSRLLHDDADRRRREAAETARRADDRRRWAGFRSEWDSAWSDFLAAFDQGDSFRVRNPQAAGEALAAVGAIVNRLPEMRLDFRNRSPADLLQTLCTFADWHGRGPLAAAAILLEAVHGADQSQLAESLRRLDENENLRTGFGWLEFYRDRLLSPPGEVNSIGWIESTEALPRVQAHRDDLLFAERVLMGQPVAGLRRDSANGSPPNPPGPVVSDEETSRSEIPPAKTPDAFPGLHPLLQLRGVLLDISATAPLNGSRLGVESAYWSKYGDDPTTRHRNFVDRMTELLDSAVVRIGLDRDWPALNVSADAIRGLVQQAVGYSSPGVLADTATNAPVIERMRAAAAPLAALRPYFLIIERLHPPLPSEAEQPGEFDVELNDSEAEETTPSTGPGKRTPKTIELVAFVNARRAEGLTVDEALTRLKRERPDDWGDVEQGSMKTSYYRARKDSTSTG